MTGVFILTSGFCCEATTVGVYASREAAEATAAWMAEVSPSHDHQTIEEWTVNNLAGVRLHEATGIVQDGAVVSVHPTNSNVIKPISAGSVNVLEEWGTNDYGVRVYVTAEADSEHAAIRAATEHVERLASAWSDRLAEQQRNGQVD
jgi:hypothetical protein